VAVPQFCEELQIRGLISFPFFYGGVLKVGKRIKRTVYACPRCKCYFFSQLDLDYHMTTHTGRVRRR